MNGLHTIEQKREFLKVLQMNKGMSFEAMVMSLETAIAVTTNIAEVAKKCFFQAMREGYVSGILPVIKLDNGWSKITWKGDHDRFEVVDSWGPANNEKDPQVQRGYTKIFFNGNLVWSMLYKGHYPKEVIPLLKQALAAAYNEDKFYAGRGIPVWTIGEYVYRNLCEREGFMSFRTREEIRDLNGKLLGYHEAFGGWME